MARLDALANRFADALVTALRTINAGPGVNTWGAAADDTKWLTQPKTVQRGLFASILTLENDPSICVEVQSWRALPEGGGGPHSLALAIAVHMKAGGADVAEIPLNKLAADVAYLLAQNETFAALAEQIVQTGPIAYEPQTDIMLRGLPAVATLTAEFELQYDHSLTTPP